ncbi:hypothetical protein [Paractinoplanes lichenicola]|uniref:Uncharacterized protein n=1 Tax=Paractinoplanes lichenicola TaxID=2802976 RepID=A0ABS1VKG8_9ACTN|nr:hypothetical protein [Actinoplanes lichenicola]MBL7254760.1 hypothetical protein [Actinoplanes lichenicola]
MMTPDERDRAQLKRMEFFEQSENDRLMIQRYRENEWFYIDRLVDVARNIGRLDERLGDSDES